MRPTLCVILVTKIRLTRVVTNSMSSVEHRLPLHHSTSRWLIFDFSSVDLVFLGVELNFGKGTHLCIINETC